MPTNIKKKAVINRVKSLEEDIAKARDYLETGAHAHWHGFRPVFLKKVKNGKIVPPHKDWIKNVFLPGRERALSKAEKLLDRVE